MKVEEFDKSAELLSKIIGFYEDMNKSLLNAAEIGVFIDNISVAKDVLPDLKKLVPPTIYSKYAAYFTSFEQILTLSGEVNFLSNNKNDIAGAFGVAANCIKEFRESVLDEKQMFLWLSESKLDLAEEGKKVLQIGESDLLEKWFSYYAPHLERYVYPKPESVEETEAILSDIDGECFRCALIPDFTEFSDVASGQVQKIEAHLENPKALYFKGRIGAPGLGEDIVIDEEFCKNGPLVSVVMSSYNHDEYVGRAIESVLNQTYKNIEFLVADDASPDNSVAVIKQYEDRLAKVWYYEENAGATPRLEFLYDQASGKYCTGLDCDDYWDENKIYLQVKYMTEHPECDVCFTGFRFENSKGEELNRVLPPNRDGADWVHYMFNHGNTFSNSSWMIKNELIKDHSIKYGYCMRQVPDLFKWSYYCSEKNVHIITKALTTNFYFSGGEKVNISVSNPENDRRALVEVANGWRDYFEKVDDDTFQKAFSCEFIRKDACTEEEYLCEKYFLMLNYDNSVLQHNALQFYAKYYQRIRNCIVDRYNYRQEDYWKDELEKGVLGLVKALNISKKD